MNGINHHLHGVQKAMNLPETFELGEVLDVVFRSCLENLVFIHSSRIVHRNCEFIVVSL